jgi:predicted ATP-dependent endonuclease of OLD family
MRLAQFEIINFKGIQHIIFNWEDIIILIGENNTCKTSVLEALNYFLTGEQINNPELFHDRKNDEDHAIELIGRFDCINDIDKKQVAIQGRLYKDKWIIKKKYWLTEKNGKYKAESQYYSWGTIETFKKWPKDEDNWENWPAEYNDLIEVVKKEKKGKCNGPSRELLKAKVKEKRNDLLETKDDWIPDPGGGGGWKSNANSIIPKYILVPAVYDVTSEANFKGKQKTTTYGEILKLVLEKKLSSKEEIKELQKSLKKVKHLFVPDDDPDKWKKAAEINEVEEKISKLLDKIIKAKAKLIPGEIHLDEILLPSTKLRIDDGHETEIEHQGHGLQRTLIMSLLQVLLEYEQMEQAIESATTQGEITSEFKRSVIFAVEEPELYMHPQMERKVRDTLYELAEQPNQQVICSTHSPIFLDMALKHKAIVRLEKDDHRNITVKQVTEEIFNGQDAKENKNKLRMIIEFDPTVNELFFAKKLF